MKPKTLIIAALTAGSLEACYAGVPPKPINDAASLIAKDAAGGKAAREKCATDTSVCALVDQAFDNIASTAAELQKLSGSAQ